MAYNGQFGWYTTLEGDFPDVSANKNYPALIVNIDEDDYPEGGMPVIYYDILVFTPKGVFPKRLEEVDVFEGDILQAGKFTLTSGTVARKKLVELLGLSQSLIIP